MASSRSRRLSLLLFFFISIPSFALAAHRFDNRISMAFPLSIAAGKPSTAANRLSSSLLQRKTKTPIPTPAPPFDYNYKSAFKYSMALVVSLPIGTPPQAQQMVLDTGSQLSWIQCHRKSPKKPPPVTSFDPTLSSSFSELPCNHPICKPRIPDFTLPTTCDQNRLCHYSYFYADGTLAEGNLVRERFAFPRSRTTPPLILGCSAEPSEAEGILGMNLGRLSFVSQAKVPKFSYCVPFRRGQDKVNRTGAFYLGRNPNSGKFRYVNLQRFSQNQRMPNLDPLAYTIPMTGIKIGGTRLNISPSAFRPDAGGSGQTMIDSGTQYTFLVDAAYEKVRDEVVRRAGVKLKKGYVYGGAMDMCVDGGDTAAAETGRLIGDVAFEFENGVEILVRKENVLDDVGGGVHCVGIGRSGSLGVASNIIGNFHQQNLWVEFDLIGRRVGFGEADCSKSL
ncbi:aspartic proteinase PCS1-like [Andrographis paniculata]|uniref:aspartic proteinase PCS1-like n=1 Tax=Andrographis paniculata TaxID=175694 RepID=UPI0021E96CBA|nr:aspartic proteinase PCS1-like [Andrographis paniculata]